MITNFGIGPKSVICLVLEGLLVDGVGVIVGVGAGEVFGVADTDTVGVIVGVVVIDGVGVI